MKTTTVINLIHYRKDIYLYILTSHTRMNLYSLRPASQPASSTSVASHAFKKLQWTGRIASAGNVPQSVCS